MGMGVDDKKGFDLGNYVEVKDRLGVLYEFFPKARIASHYELTREPDDKPKVIVTSLVYREPDDNNPSIGLSWMYLPGTTPYTRGSELENAQTSAVGRAIGFMGILIDKSIASANEIAAKKDARVAPPIVERVEVTGILSIGTSTASDGKLRESPTGWTLGFNLTTGPRQWVRVTVLDDMALQMAEENRELRPGLPLKVFGPIESLEDHLADRTIKFRRVTAEKIVADDWEYPHPRQTGPGLFDPADEAELDAAIP